MQGGFRGRLIASTDVGLIFRLHRTGVSAEFGPMRTSGEGEEEGYIGMFHEPDLA